MILFMAVSSAWVRRLAMPRRVCQSNIVGAQTLRREESAALIRCETQNWIKLIRDAGIKPG
jgi:hypothetical protein